MLSHAYARVAGGAGACATLPYKPCFEHLTQRGKPVPPPPPTRTKPPRAAGSGLREVGLRTKIELQVEFGDEIFFFQFVHCLNLTVSRSGASFLRTFNSNLHVATSVCLRRPSRLVPTSGARISQFLPACVRRKQAQHASCPSRTGGLVRGSCRCAPPPDPLGWPCGGSRRSPLLARRRTARNSLNGSRPSRAAWLLSHRELSHRAYRFGRTLHWPRRGCLVCVIVVSCHASE